MGVCVWRRLWLWLTSPFDQEAFDQEAFALEQASLEQASLDQASLDAPSQRLPVIESNRKQTADGRIRGLQTH
jgi:hypothetical protein